MLVIITFGCFYCSTVRADVSYFDMGTGDLICHDERGRKIPVVENYEAENYLDEAKAGWDAQNNRRMIFISDTIKRDQPMSVIAIVAYHECGHHQLGHNLWRIRMWSDQDIKEERQADCFSAERYFINHGAEAYEQMLIDVKKAKLMDMKRYEVFKRCIPL